MKNTVLLFCVFIALSVAGCVRDEVCENVPAGDGETWMTLDFGNDPYERITVTTRAVLGETAESRVMNIYAFIFDAAGNRIYGHYFDASESCLIYTTPTPPD